MSRLFFTITGMNHYYGSEFLKPGMKVMLVKEPDNDLLLAMVIGRKISALSGPVKEILKGKPPVRFKKRSRSVS